MQVNFTLISRFARAYKLLKIKMFAESVHQLPHDLFHFNQKSLFLCSLGNSNRL